ncbi:MAG TPA: ATP synthase F1 subunit gamma [Porphyromonadaceae bacterium]|nr:ATP synthase F1 subunit gamma [Porphyromonadaceae bacterium]
MATLRELKTRIGSVSSSEKITGAMKMISSAKVHKFEQSLRQLLPYKNQIQSIMGHILESGESFNSPLIETREVKTICLVAYGSDDGLCGAYNMNVFKHTLSVINEMRDKYGNAAKFVIYPVGRKIAKAVSKLQDGDISVVREAGVDSKMDGAAVNAFTMKLQEGFLNHDFDVVYSVYTNFISMARQRLKYEQMLPVDSAAIAKEATMPVKDENKMYIFEPGADSIFRQVLPMFVLSAMQEITLENRASEQAARVMAMQSANDNARKLLEELQLEYNKLRQQSITTELLDILGGQVQH